MKFKYLIYIFLSAATLSACSADDSVLNEDNKRANITINISQSGVAKASGSRSVTEMPLEDANLMYNIILLHYNSNQILQEVVCDDNADLKNGNYEETWKPSLKTGSDDYIVLLANIKESNDGLETIQKWNDMGAARFANFRDIMKINLPLTNSTNGLYAASKKMYMLGYYHGAVQSGKELNIMMGRMATCIKLVIAPVNGSAQITKVEMMNAVGDTHYFPATDAKDATYINYVDQLSSTATQDAPLILYYYTGENINPSNYTTAKITARVTSTNTYNKYSNTNTDASLTGYTLISNPFNDTYSTYKGYLFEGKYYKHRIKYTNNSSGLTYLYNDDESYVNWSIGWGFTLDDSVDDTNYRGYEDNGVFYKYRYEKMVTSTSDKTYTVVLGSDSPSVTTDRNCSLYRNNTYTFNVNLK